MEIKVIIEAPELAKAINNLAAALGGAKTTQPVTPSVPVQTAAPPTVPVAPPPQYTKEQIMQAGAELMDAGKANDLIALLRSFNVRAVMDLKSEQLGAFATALRELGARI